MSLIECPVECLTYDSDDWLQKHSTFTLTIVGSLSAMMTLIFSYFLKSRCTKIKIGCLSCDRIPPAVNVVNEVNVENNI